jgi:hypothetical protein
MPPYRVINYYTGCCNDPHHRFDHKDFLWGLRHAIAPRRFECTRFIYGRSREGDDRAHPRIRETSTQPRRRLGRVKADGRCKEVRRLTGRNAAFDFVCERAHLAG